MTLPLMKIRVPANFPVGVLGRGGIKVSKSSGQWLIEPDFSALQTLAALDDPAGKQVWVFDPVTGDYAVLTLSAVSNSLFAATSADAVAVGTGARTFTIEANRAFPAGTWVLATSDADPATIWMLGQVTAYAGTQLSVNVAASGGSGTHGDWTLRLSGSPGQSRSSGFSYRWSSDTAASDPGAGFVKADNAAFGSVANLLMSGTDADGNALAALLATWGDGTSALKGRIKIYDPMVPSNFMAFDLAGATDAGAYVTLAVTPVAAGGSFDASSALRVEFVPKGDKGDTGATGAAGSLGTAGDGSAASPSVAFAAETGTGLFRAGAGDIGIAIGGVRKFDLTATELVLPGDPASAAAAATKQYVDNHTFRATGTGDTNASIAATTVVACTTAQLTASRTWTLPPASAKQPGERLYVIDSAGGITATNTLVVARAGADTIQDVIAGAGLVSVTLSHPGEVLCLESDGAAKWTVVEQRRKYAQLDVSGQTLSGGATVTATNLGTIASGTTTVDCGQGPLQFYTNNGAHTLAAPAADGYCNILVTNGASAGTIAFSGFTTGATGDTLTTTAGSRFLLSVVRVNSVSTYMIKALQ